MVYPITKFWFYPIFRILIRKIRDFGNIPNKGPFIIVSNHEKLIDPLIIIYPILRKLNKKTHFIARPTWWFLGEAICRQWAGCIPLLNSKQAYQEAKDFIKSGEIVGIFPEGATRRTNNPRTGAIRLAIETNASILPIGLKSSYAPFSSTLIMGKPFYAKKGKGIKKQAKDLMSYIYKLRDS